MPASYKPAYSNPDYNGVEFEEERNRVFWGNPEKKPKWFFDASFSEYCCSPDTV